MTTKNDFASIVAANLHASEKAADDQLAQLGITLTDLTTGRVPAGFAAQVGQQGLEHLAEAISLGIAARRSVVAAHDSFARDARRLKVTWTSAGPFEKMPETDRPETPVPSGRLVSN